MLSTSQTNVRTSISMVIFIQVTSSRRQDPTSPGIRVAQSALSVCRRLRVRSLFPSTGSDRDALPGHLSPIEYAPNGRTRLC